MKTIVACRKLTGVLSRDFPPSPAGVVICLFPMRAKDFLVLYIVDFYPQSNLHRDTHTHTYATLFLTKKCYKVLFIVYWCMPVPPAPPRGTSIAYVTPITSIAPTGKPVATTTPRPHFSKLQLR